MKVLTAAEMREVDRRTIEMGTPGIVLMENAAHRVVEFLAERFAPLEAQRIAVLCGKGNNGGDGMAVARQLFTRFHPRRLDVVLLATPEGLKGDAATNYKMLQVCGCPVLAAIPPEARMATLVIDALLGTGITGPAAGGMLEAIREINQGFPLAKVVAVDLPSGMPTDSGEPVGEWARADASVTFTAPKPAHVMPPNCDHVGELRVGQIGSPPSLYEHALLSLVEPAKFRALLAPRPPSGHKGTFGHVLIVAGSPGKTGAAAMSGLAALRAGAGLVTVASRAPALPLAPELMSGSLEDTGLAALAEGKTVIAMGPGLGRDDKTELLVREALEGFHGPMILDADALDDRQYSGIAPRILTPHPGEMGRLTGKSIAEIQKDRIHAARAYATARHCTLVLKGQRTLIAFHDGRVWINPTGTPAMGTGGAGDVLTGLIAGLLAQFPKQPDEAVAAAVYLHGLAGEMGACELGEKPLIATDILRYLPGAIAKATEACAGLPDAVEAHVKREFVYSQGMLVWVVQTGCTRVGRLLVLTLTAIVLHKILNSGRNRPAVFGWVDQDGNPVGEFVVKLSGAMETRDRGPASELIASCLAGHFGISRPEPAAVEVHPDLAVWLSKRKPELEQVLRNSGGVNFGSKFLMDVSNWPVGKSLPDGMLPAAVSIFAFDCLISNDDRRRDNSNVLVRGDDIFVIDHEAGFAFLYVPSARNRPWEVRHLNALRNHVFFYQLRRQPLDLGPFIARLAALSDGKLESMIRDVPGQWYHADLGRISEHLRSIRDHAAEFEREILEALA